MKAQYTENGRVKRFEVSTDVGVPPLRLTVSLKDCPKSAPKMRKLVLNHVTEDLAVYEVVQE